MRFRRALPGALLVAAALGALGSWQAGWGRDPAPCRFTGAARVRLAPAPSGTVVEAWVDDRRVAETTVRREGDEAAYVLQVPGRYRDRTVVFRFPAYPQLSRAGLAGCEAGREQVVNLDADAHQGCGGA